MPKVRTEVPHKKTKEPVEAAPKRPRGRPRKELTDQEFIKACIKAKRNVAEIERITGIKYSEVRKRMARVNHLRAQPEFAGQMHRKFQPEMLLDFMPAYECAGIIRTNTVNDRSKEYNIFLGACVMVGEIIIFADQLWVCTHDEPCGLGTSALSEESAELVG